MISKIGCLYCEKYQSCTRTSFNVDDLHIYLQKKGKKVDKEDSDDSDGLEDLDGIMVLAAAGKKGKKKGKSSMSAFQMLDVEEPDISQVRETLLGFDFIAFFAQCSEYFLLAIASDLPP